MLPSSAPITSATQPTRQPTTNPTDAPSNALTTLPTLDRISLIPSQSPSQCPITATALPETPFLYTDAKDACSTNVLQQQRTKRKTKTNH